VKVEHIPEKVELEKKKVFIGRVLRIHEGYEYADENAIQLLSEVVHEYFN
jgi:hypothetical protein